MKTVLIIDQPYCTTAAIQIGFNQIELKGDPFKRKLKKILSVSFLKITAVRCAIKRKYSVMKK